MRTNAKPFQLRFSENNIRQLSLTELENHFRASIDAEFGIVSYEVRDERYPTGVAWVRDATHESLPSRDENEVNKVYIEANNTLLRCLTRFKGIKHALDQLVNPNRFSYVNTKFCELYELILAEVYSDDSQDEKVKYERIKQFEVGFNNFLIQVLYNEGLTADCETEKDYEELLFHYRNLASVVDPAKSLITINYHPVFRILHRTTQHPVTEKTDSQQSCIQEMYGETKVANYHSRSKRAFQQANQFFAANLSRNNTMLPAQARKTHLPTVKHAFIVIDEFIIIENAKLIFYRKQNNIDFIFNQLLNQTHKRNRHQLITVRCASPVFVGKGETTLRMKKHAEENFKQISLTAKKILGLECSVSLHIICLLTDIPYEGQNKVVGILEEVAKDKETSSSCHLSKIPVNIVGVSFLPDIDHIHSSVTSNHPGMQRYFLKKANRYELAAQFTLALAEEFSCQQPNASLPSYHCNSGMDRTTIIWLLTLIYWLTKHTGCTAQIKEKIENWVVSARNAEEIATHSSLGTRGVKIDSTSKGYLEDKGALSQRTEDQIHTPSSDMNLSNVVSKVPEKKLTAQEMVNFNMSTAQLSFLDRHPNLQTGLKVAAFLATSFLLFTGVGAAIYFSGGLAAGVFLLLFPPITLSLKKMADSLGITKLMEEKAPAPKQVSTTYILRKKKKEELQHIPRMINPGVTHLASRPNTPELPRLSQLPEPMPLSFNAAKMQTPPQSPTVPPARPTTNSPSTLRRTN